MTRHPRSLTQQRWALSMALVVAAVWFVGASFVLSRGWTW